MSSQAQSEYAAFLEKVKRTLYIDNLSPQVTESVLRTALDQFGNVKGVNFIPNYLEPKNIPQCALVEMENAKQAKATVTAMTEFPFMMSGMPRPVRARLSEEKMFDDRPTKPGRKIQIRWMEPTDPDYEVAKRLKRLTHKHAAEASFMLKQQLMEEEKLAEQQTKMLKVIHKKYDMIDSIMTDGASRRLGQHYRVENLEN